MLKREIQRIGNQVRRVLHRLNDALSAVEKNTMQLQTNSISVMDEIDDIYRYTDLVTYNQDGFLTTRFYCLIYIAVSRTNIYLALSNCTFI